MILSKKHGFIFIKGRKVASTSVEALLSSVCGSEDIITPITNIDEKQRINLFGTGAQNYGADRESLGCYFDKLRELSDERVAELEIPKGSYHNHMPLKEVVKLYGDIPDSWLLIVAERNPYEKVISLANMSIGFSQYVKNGQPMESSVNSIKNAIENLFVSGRIDKSYNLPLYQNPAGERELTVLRYENLQSDIRSLFLDLGLKSHHSLPHFKKGVSKKLLPKCIFNREQLDVINKLYNDEFVRFGYEMI